MGLQLCPCVRAILPGQDCFLLEVESDNAFRERSTIADINERVERLIEAKLRIGQFALVRQEATPEFLTAIDQAIERRLTRPDVSDRHRQLLQAVHEALRAENIQSQVGRDRNPVPAATPDEGVALEKLTEQDYQQALDVDYPHEIESAMVDLIESAKIESRRALLMNSDAPEGVFVTALRQLFHRDPAPDGYTSSSAALLKELDVLIDRVVKSAPHQMVQYGEETFSLAEAVRLGARGHYEFLCTAAAIACSSRPHSRQQDFWTSLTILITRLEIDSPHIVLRFLAFMLCAEFLGQVGQPIMAAGAYAASILTMAPGEKMFLRIPKVLARPYAIAWQRLGHCFQNSGSSEVAALCAGVSARVFKFTGDMDGYVRSRLDGLSFGTNFGDPQSRIGAARELLYEIRNLHETEPNSSIRFRDRVLERARRLAIRSLERATSNLIPGNRGKRRRSTTRRQCRYSFSPVRLRRTPQNRCGKRPIGNPAET